MDSAEWWYFLVPKAFCGCAGEEQGVRFLFTKIQHNFWPDRDFDDLRYQHSLNL